MKKVLEYLGKRYDEEQNRFKNFEDKSARLLSFLSLLVGAIVALGGVRGGFILNPSDFPSWLALVAYLASGICVFCSWGHTMLALRVVDCPILPKSRIALEYLSAIDEEEQDKYIYNCYVDTLDVLAGVIDEKAKNLELAYQELAIGAWLLAASLVYFAVLEIVK
ncbi:hypothetical protein [Metapseudomonas otitidis]|uniref:hypothetical protein n=1 Tax=Metapseudomonas otitidis TaxID=319939 RepID=UPI00280B770F|nr:hypothetical protein [Pseudomonas otitidis]